MTLIVTVIPTNSRNSLPWTVMTYRQRSCNQRVENLISIGRIDALPILTCGVSFKVPWKGIDPEDILRPTNFSSSDLRVAMLS